MERENLTIIDGKSVFYRGYYAMGNLSLPDGTPIYESFPGRSTSACNYLEVAAIIELLKRMAEEYKKAGYGKGKKKNVGVFKSQRCKTESCFFTSGKNVDAFKHIVAGKSCTSQRRSEGQFVRPWKHIPHLVKHRF